VEIVPLQDLDKHEGEIISRLISESQEPLADDTQWLEESIKRNVLLTSIDSLLNWARRYSLWPVIHLVSCLLCSGIYGH